MNFINFLKKKGFGIFKNNLYYISNTDNFNEVIPKINVKIKIFDENNISKIAQIRSFKLYKIIKTSLLKGCIGIYAEYNNEIVSYGWVSINKSNNFIKPNPIFLQPPFSGYIFNCYTSKNFRGNNLYPFIVYQLTKLTFNHNIQNLFIDTDCQNLQANKGLRKNNFKFVGTFISIIMFNILFYSNLKKKLKI